MDQSTHHENPNLILRDFSKHGPLQEPGVALFKAPGNRLEGYIYVNGVKLGVVAHITDRSANQSSDEPTLKIFERHGNANDAKLAEIGRAYPVRTPSDQPAWFDHMSLEVGDQRWRVRVNNHTDLDFRRQLGFTNERLEPSKTHGQTPQERVAATTDNDSATNPPTKLSSVQASNPDGEFADESRKSPVHLTSGLNASMNGATVNSRIEARYAELKAKEASRTTSRGLKL